MSHALTSAASLQDLAREFDQVLSPLRGPTARYRFERVFVSSFKNTQTLMHFGGAQVSGTKGYPRIKYTVNNSQWAIWFCFGSVESCFGFSIWNISVAKWCTRLAVASCTCACSCSCFRGSRIVADASVSHVLAWRFRDLVGAALFGSDAEHEKAPNSVFGQGARRGLCACVGASNLGK
jgi:hypothetical protein